VSRPSRCHSIRAHGGLYPGPSQRSRLLFPRWVGPQVLLYACSSQGFSFSLPGESRTRFMFIVGVFQPFPCWKAGHFNAWCMACLSMYEDTGFMVAMTGQARSRRCKLDGSSLVGQVRSGQVRSGQVQELMSYWYGSLGGTCREQSVHYQDGCLGVYDSFELRMGVRPRFCSQPLQPLRYP